MNSRLMKHQYAHTIPLERQGRCSLLRHRVYTLQWTRFPGKKGWKASDECDGLRRPGTGRHDSREFAIVGKIDLSQFAGVASSNTIFDFKHLLLIIYCN